MLFGHYPDCDQSISWLKMESNKEYDIFLSEYAVSAKPFLTERKKAYWNESSLFEWISKDFLTLYFSESERMQILEVSIPAIDQIIRWMPEKSARKCFASELAISNGVDLFPDDEGCCVYWLQDTGRRNGYSATVVLANGNIYRSSYMLAGNVGVRPYIKIKKP